MNEPSSTCSKSTMAPSRAVPWHLYCSALSFLKCFMMPSRTVTKRQRCHVGCCMTSSTQTTVPSWPTQRKVHRLSLMTSPKLLSPKGWQLAWKRLKCNINLTQPRSPATKTSPSATMGWRLYTSSATLVGSSCRMSKLMMRSWHSSKQHQSGATLTQLHGRQRLWTGLDGIKSTTITQPTLMATPQTSWSPDLKHDTLQPPTHCHTISCLSQLCSAKGWSVITGTSISSSGMRLRGDLLNLRKSPSQWLSATLHTKLSNKRVII